VFILKGFKSCVLEVRILRELRARFAEERILKDLVGRLVGKWAAGADGDFNAEGTGFTEAGSGGEKRGSREVEE
jgi:hypothetical protein